MGKYGRRGLVNATLICSWVESFYYEEEKSSYLTIRLFFLLLLKSWLLPLFSPWNLNKKSRKIG